MSEDELKKAMAFSKDYIDFMNAGKTEREVVEHIVDIVKNAGYEDFDEIIKQGKKLVPGQKIYSVSNEKALILAVIGESGPEKGFSMIGSHVDAPRLGLSNRCHCTRIPPLHWQKPTTMAVSRSINGLPFLLQCMELLSKNDGTKVRIRIGDKEDDPVFTISDLLPHLSQDQLKKRLPTFILGENLNVFLGSMPSENGWRLLRKPTL
jgi:aspartyl aminopeptidase